MPTITISIDLTIDLIHRIFLSSENTLYSCEKSRSISFCYELYGSNEENLQLIILSVPLCSSENTRIMKGQRSMLFQSIVGKFDGVFGYLIQSVRSSNTKLHCIWRGESKEKLEVRKLSNRSHTVTLPQECRDDSLLGFFRLLHFLVLY